MNYYFVDEDETEEDRARVRADHHRWHIFQVESGCWWVCPPALVDGRFVGFGTLRGGTYSTGAEALAAYVTGTRFNAAMLTD